MSEDTGLFDPGLEDLPSVVPIFPLQGVLLLPGGRLPLNIFEPRYLCMLRDALAGHRLIGMVQPILGDEEPGDFEPEPTEDMPVEDLGASAAEDVGSAVVYRVGCVGRIISFSETDDGRYLITLKGLLRFRIARELPLVDGYRRVEADYAGFEGDLDSQSGHIDRGRFLDALRSYFDREGIEADWDAIKQASNERLVTSLAMVCPFSSAEKQALLEAPDLAVRAETMITILEMAIMGADSAGATISRH